MRTHTTQENPQTKKDPPHNPIVISRDTESNIKEIIKIMEAPDTAILYITPNSSYRRNALFELQTQIEDRPYEVNTQANTVRMINNSTIRFMRGDNRLMHKIIGLQLTKAYIDGELSLPAVDYNHLIHRIMARIRPTTTREQA